MLLLGVSLAGFAQHAQAGAARLAETFLVAIVAIALADADAVPAGRTVQQHVGDADRHLLGEPAALGVAAARLQVLVDPVDALDHDLVLARQNAQHSAGAALLGVVAGDHFHQVVFANVHVLLSSAKPQAAQTTSAARLMMRAKPHSRSSRATAPKMRVPRGFFSASMMTMALRSKRTYEPSSRRVGCLQRTMTPLTTSPGFTSPPGIAFLTLATMTSPTPAYRLRLPPSTLMHMHSLAPVLSATSIKVYIWIIKTVP